MSNEKEPKRLIYTVRRKDNGQVLAYVRAKNRTRACSAAADMLLEVELSDQETLLGITAADVRNADDDADQSGLPLGEPEPPAAPKATDWNIEMLANDLRARGFNVTMTIVGGWTDEERELAAAHLVEQAQEVLPLEPPAFLAIYDTRALAAN